MRVFAQFEKDSSELYSEYCKEKALWHVAILYMQGTWILTFFLED